MIDHALLIAAGKLATGAHIHTVAQKMTVYQIGSESLAMDNLSDETRAMIAKLVDDAELWLRRFVAAQRQAS